MSPDRRRQTRAQTQAETRTRLLDAAAEEFAAHGFAGASIDAITARAGYSRGAFYSNFASKADLLLELSEVQMARFSTTALPAILAATEPDRTAEAARYLLTDAPTRELLVLVELARLRPSHPELGGVIDRLTSRSLAFVDEVITAADTASGALAGVAGDAAERRALTQALLAAVLGLLLLRDLDVDLGADAAERLLRGVLAPPADDTEGGPG